MRLTIRWLLHPARRHYGPHVRRSILARNARSVVPLRFALDRR